MYEHWMLQITSNLSIIYSQLMNAGIYGVSSKRGHNRWIRLTTTPLANPKKCVGVWRRGRSISQYTTQCNAVNSTLWNSFGGGEFVQLRRLQRSIWLTQFLAFKFIFRNRQLKVGLFPLWYAHKLNSFPSIWMYASDKGSEKRKRKWNDTKFSVMFAESIFSAFGSLNHCRKPLFVPY